MLLVLPSIFQRKWLTFQARKGGDEISIETDTDLGAGDVVSLEGTPVTAEPPPGLVPANNPTMTAGVIPTVVRTIAQLPTGRVTHFSRFASAGKRMAVMPTFLVVSSHWLQPI